MQATLCRSHRAWHMRGHGYRARYPAAGLLKKSELRQENWRKTRLSQEKSRNRGDPILEKSIGRVPLVEKSRSSYDSVKENSLIYMNR